MPTLNLGDIVDQYNHIQDDRRVEIVVASCVNCALAVIAVVLRFISRRIVGARLLADDWFILAALIGLLFQFAVSINGVTIGYGRHVVLLRKPQTFAEIAIATQNAYLVGSTLIKVSIYCLYNRIFGSVRHFKAILWVLGIIAWMYAISGVLVVTFQCRPVNAAWNFQVEGDCVNIGLAGQIAGSINVLLDVITLCLPIPLVWRLNMQLKWRLQIIALFALGIFICAGSAWRTAIVHRLSLMDATWADVDPGIWAMTENAIGVVCASGPTLRPVFSLLARGHRCTSRQGYCSGCEERSSAGRSPRWKAMSFGGRWQSVSERWRNSTWGSKSSSRKESDKPRASEKSISVTSRITIEESGGGPPPTGPYMEIF